MDRLTKWFYNRTKRRMEQELEPAGLSVLDPDKFHLHVKKMNRSNMINTFIIVAIIIALILKQIIGG